MSTSLNQNDWTKPSAMAIPDGGFFKDKIEQGRYGPLFPKTPACYRFSIIAKIVPGSESKFHEYARNIETAVAGQPDVLAVLKLHYLRWNLFQIKGDTYFQYMGIFDTDFDKYTEDAVSIFSVTGLRTVFEKLEVDDIQHILLTRAPALTGRYEFLSFGNPAGGRAWLSAILELVQSVQQARTSIGKDRRWVTVAFTWNGLRALELDERSLATF